MRRNVLQSRFWQGCILILLLPVLSPVIGLADSKHEYIMGVFPHLPPRELEKIYAPMAADISRVIGKPVIFRTSSSYQKFMEQLDNQEFDIAFVQPFDYIRIADKYGYTPLATRQEMLSAILVIQQDSSIQSIKDLNGKTIALPPVVAAVSYLIKNHLLKNGLKTGEDVTIVHTHSHVSCMQKVLSGKADACGTAAPALRFFEYKMKVSLRAIGRTRSIPHTLFSIHPRVPAEHVKAIKELILGWFKSDKGKKMLSRGRLKPFRSVSDSDYDVVREIAR